MTDAERETLESLRVGDIETRTLDAIRSLLAEVERLLAHQKINEQKIEEQTKEIETHLSDKVKLRAEIERLRADRDRFQAIVHAVSPYLDPAALGLTPEVAREKLRSLLAEIERLRAEVNLLKEDRIKVVAAQRETIIEYKARIDAALAKAQSVVHQSDDAAAVASDPRSHVAIARIAREVVKALEGEKRA